KDLGRPELAESAAISVIGVGAQECIQSRRQRGRKRVGGLDEERVPHAVALTDWIGCEHREGRGDAELRERSADRAAHEAFAQLLSEVIDDAIVAPDEAERRSSSNEALYFDAIAKPISPQPAGGGDYDGVRAATRQFIDDARLAVVIQKLKEVRANRDGPAAGVRDGDERLGCQQTLRLKSHAR